MAMTTNYRVDYTKKRLEPVKTSRKESDPPKASPKFKGLSTYTSDYPNWGKKKKVVPNTARKSENPTSSQPMKTPKRKLSSSETMPRPAPPERQPLTQPPPEPQPTYSQQPTARNSKPLNPLYSSDAPLEEETEYRTEYTKKPFSRCPVPAIEAGAHAQYTFLEQDEKGHKWYELQPLPPIPTA